MHQKTSSAKFRPRQFRGQRELRITELRRSLEEERQEATAQAATLYDPMCVLFGLPTS